MCICIYVVVCTYEHSPLPGKSWRELRWQKSGNVMFADLCQFSPTKQPSGVSFNSTKLSKHVRGEINDAPDVSLLVVRPDFWPIIDSHKVHIKQQMPFLFYLEFLVDTAVCSGGGPTYSIL